MQMTAPCACGVYSDASVSARFNGGRIEVESPRADFMEEVGAGIAMEMAKKNRLGGPERRARRQQAARAGGQRRGCAGGGVDGTAPVRHRCAPRAERAEGLGLGQRQTRSEDPSAPRLSCSDPAGAPPADVPFMEREGESRQQRRPRFLLRPAKRRDLSISSTRSSV